MLAQMLDPSDKDRNFLNVSKEDKTVLLINNLGGVSPLELGGITTEVCDQLASAYGIVPARVLSGTFMTSLNGLGFSISLLKLVDTGLGSGSSILELLDAPAEAVGWTPSVKTRTWDMQCTPVQDIQGKREENETQSSNIKSKETSIHHNILLNRYSVRFAEARTALTSGLNRLIKAEPDITHYDTIVGDGDCGIGLKRGAEGECQYTRQTCMLPPKYANKAR
jgi:dihydroxyacetone kinase